MSAMTNIQKLFSSVLGKILSIGFLILLLLIPISMVEDVISERVGIYRQAKSEITGSWGKEVSLIDPVLTVNRTGWSHGDNRGYYHNEFYNHHLPDKLKLNGKIETQLRQLGIYKVPVYTGKVHIIGDFVVTNEINRDYELDEIATLQIILNARSLKKIPEFKWHGKSLPVFTEKIAESGNQLVFYAKLDNDSKLVIGKNPFEITLEISGSNMLTFRSGARESETYIESNWDSPGFFGGMLPLSYNVTDKSFDATWKSSNFFIDIGGENNNRIKPDWFKHYDSYGVKFIQTVDVYQQVTRVIKYAVLFLTLIFATYFLFEILGSKLLYPIQYLFVGFTNCVFYLLLLSLAEHIGFNSAYFISVFLSSTLIALYSKSILKSRIHGVLIFIKLCILYSFLLIVLKSEDLALLIGSVGLFLILASTMYFTRNFNWTLQKKVSDPQE